MPGAGPAAEPFGGIRSAILSHAGMKAAREYGAHLPSFASQVDAERALYADRDELLRDLLAAAERSETFEPTFQPESLKIVEAWYFELWEQDSFSKAGIARHRLERAIAMYVGETAVRTNPEFQWFVSEYPFVPGKYQIGIGKPLFSWLAGSFADLYARPNNKRRQSIWREFKEYIASGKQLKCPTCSTSISPLSAVDTAGVQSAHEAIGMAADPYPLFVPPNNLGSKTPREWSLAEARSYRDWQLRELEKRTGHLLTYLGVDRCCTPEEVLEGVGQHLAATLRRPEFSEVRGDGLRLTDAGYAISADAGLLVAKLVLEACGDRLKWSIVRKPKSDASYNLPVLIGFAQFPLEFEPVGVSIADAHAILQGSGQWSAWRVVYEDCCKDVS